MELALMRLAFGLAVSLLLAAPAGAGITYSVLGDGVWQVYFQESLGSEPRALRAEMEADAGAPAAAPDGRRVAFEVSGKAILVCPIVAGTNCEEVSTDRGTVARPTWDPRSGEIVFVRYLADHRGEDSDIFITRDGLRSFGPLVTHTGNQDDPDVSPDGRRLVYSSAQTISLHQAGVQVVRHLWLMDLTNGVARPLAPGPSQDMHPDFSPDGKSVAFASDRSGGVEIWIVGTGGEGLRKVTSGPGAKIWPAWSPNGESILYVRTQDGRQNLWIVGADGSDPRPFEPFGPAADVQIRDPDWR